MKSTSHTLCTIFHQLLELIKTKRSNEKINSGGLSWNDVHKNAILPQSYIPSWCRETKKKNTVHYIHRRAPNFTNKWSTDKSKVSKCIINNSVKRVQTQEYSEVEAVRIWEHQQAKRAWDISPLTRMNLNSSDKICYQKL